MASGQGTAGPTGAGAHLTCWGEFALHDRATGADLRPRGRKARALIAYLALHPGKSIGRERIAGLLWGDRGDEQARASLRQTVFELKPLVEQGLLHLGREDVALTPELLTLDLDDIAAAEADGARLAALLPDPDERLFANLHDVDESFDDWLAAERAAQDERLNALVVRAAATATGEAGASLNRWLARRGMDAPVRRAEPPTPVRAAPAGRATPKSGAAISLPLALASAVALVASAALVAPTRSPARPDGPKLVAVLPFEPITKAQAGLAEGLWEETRGALGRNQAFRVVGRTTTKVLAKDELSAATWRKRVGADYVLDGSVREGGGRVRVAVNLVRTSDGASLWDHVFEARADDALGLEQTIASEIEGRLRARLAPGGGVRATQIATSREVLALYNQARALMRDRDWQKTRDATVLLRRAVATDANFAPAWSTLGVALLFGQYGPEESEQRTAEARACVRRALSLAPNLAEAHAALAQVQGEGEPASITALQRAVALDPNNAEAWNWLGNALGEQAREAAALAAHERAFAVDPLWPTPAVNLVVWYAMRNDNPGIERLITRVRRAGGDAATIQLLRSTVAMERGDFSGAALPLIALRRDPSLNVSPGALGSAFVAVGMGEVAARLWNYPPWFGPALRGEQVPPLVIDGKRVGPRDIWMVETFGIFASRSMINNGQSARVVDLYHRAFHSREDALAALSANGTLPWAVPTLAVALRSTGDTFTAGYLLSALEAWLSERFARVPDDRGLLWQLGKLRAAQGQTAQALAALERAAALGWLPDGQRDPVDIAQEPALAGLKATPRFLAVRARMLNHAARERAEMAEAARQI